MSVLTYRTSEDSFPDHKDDDRKYSSETPSSSSSPMSVVLEDKQKSHVRITAAALESGPIDPPTDEGVIAWLQCLGGFGILLSTWGLIGSYGVFQTYYQTQALRHVSPSSIAWIGSLQSAITMFGAPVAGWMFDRGYGKHMIRTGSVLTVLGMMLTSVCRAYWQFVFAQGLVTGLGMACVFMPSIALLSTWFVRRRAFAVSLASSGVGVGGIGFSIAFDQLLPRIGFGWTVRVITFILMAFLLVANLTARQRTTGGREAGKLFDMSAWKSVPYVMLTTGSFLAYLGLYLPFYYMQVYSTSVVRLSTGIVPYVIPLLNVGFAIGRVPSGLLADYIGAFNTMVPALLVCSVMGFCWEAIREEASLVTFCLLFGMFAGPFGSLGPATTANITPDLSVFGVWMGMMYVPMGIGLLIGPPVGGVILKTSGWLGLGIFCGCSFLAGAILVVCTRIMSTGWRIRVRF